MTLSVTPKGPADVLSSRSIQDEFPSGVGAGVCRRVPATVPGTKHCDVGRYLGSPIRS